MVFGTVICLLIPGQLMGLFTHTKATIQAGETALRIIGAGFIVSAVSVTSSGALEGLGKGTPSLLISLCRYVVVIIPAAFYSAGFRSGWRLECVLDHGSDLRGHFPYHLPQGDCKTCDDGPKGMNAVTIDCAGVTAEKSVLRITSRWSRWSCM